MVRKRVSKGKQGPKKATGSVSSKKTAAVAGEHVLRTKPDHKDDTAETARGKG